MPTKGNPRHAFRFEPELWKEFLDALTRDPKARKPTAVIRDHVLWYIGRKDAPEPERPERRPPA